MEANEIREKLLSIEGELNEATREINRPSEHVVTMSVCHHAQHAMNQLMHTYLEAKGMPHDEGKSLDALYEACLQANPDFITADVRDIDCKDLSADSCKDSYCLALDKVGCCRNVAGQLKEIIWNDLNV